MSLGLDRDNFYKKISKDFSALTKLPAVQDHIDARTLGEVDASARKHVRGKRKKIGI